MGMAYRTGRGEEGASRPRGGFAVFVPVGARRGKRISPPVHRIKNPVWWRCAVKRHSPGAAR